MAVPLAEFVKGVSGFNGWTHAERIRFFAWFIHAIRGRDRFSTTDIKGCYTEVHLDPPNISQFLSDMEKRRPKEVMKDARGYYLHRDIREKFDSKYGQPVEIIPKTEQVLPNAVVAPTRRGYYIRIIQQVNGCYENGWFDACAVMIRKFVEILVIELYEQNGKADEIKDASGNFFMLSDLITTILNDAKWNLSRETKACLPLVKQMGDRAAHNRYYVATKPDVDKIIPGLRIVSDELLHLAKLK
jgi:hypothetical protein